MYLTDHVDHGKFPVQATEVQNEENWDEVSTIMRSIH